MKKGEFSEVLDTQSRQLKQTIQSNQKYLYELIESCLDLAFQSQDQPLNKKSSIKQKQEQQIQNKIRQNMQGLAELKSAYNTGLQKISNNLLSEQIKNIQSTDMQAILNEYSEKVLQLRQQIVDKQNQYYYGIRNGYQSFEDCYQKCVPTFDRLLQIQTSYDKKKTIQDECQILVGQKRQYQQLLANQKQNIKEPENVWSQVDEKQIFYQNIAQILQERQEETKGTSLNQPNQEKANAKSSLHPQPNSCKRVPFAPKYSHEQSTSCSLNKNTGNPLPGLIQRRGKKLVPDFTKMSRIDYQLFHIYFHKISRQQQRYEKLSLEYQNYLSVYKVIQQQNQNLRNKYEKRQLRMLDHHVGGDLGQSLSQYDPHIQHGKLSQFNQKQQSQKPELTAKQVRQVSQCGNQRNIKSNRYQPKLGKNKQVMQIEDWTPNKKSQNGHQNKIIQFQLTENIVSQDILIRQIRQNLQFINCEHQV